MTNHLPATLVVGATGTLGGAALNALLSSGAPVRCLVRSNDKSRTVDPRAQVAIGDLSDSASVLAALQEIDVAFFPAPHVANEEHVAQTFIDACEKRGVRLVFVGVHVDGPNRMARAFRRWLSSLWFTHYAPKFRLAERARRSKTSPVVLMPTNFFQNDELFRDELQAGTFIQPFTHPISRVDARDVGDAVARICLDPTFPSGAYPLVGLESLSGQQCAHVWSKALGYPVTYDDDPSRLDAALRRTLRGKKLDDFRKSYQAIRQVRLPTSDADLAHTRTLLGRDPTSYEAFVRDTLTRWQTLGTGIQEPQSPDQRSA